MAYSTELVNQLSSLLGTRRAYELLSNAGAGSVVVQHRNGSQSTYQSSANTDSARGSALIAAASSSVISDGDRIYLAPGRYDVGGAQIDLSASGTLSAHLIGAGMDVTTIYGTIGAGEGNVVRPGSTSLTQDLTIEAPNDSIVSHWGSNSNIPYSVADAKLVRVKLKNSNDSLTMRATGGITAKVTCFDCIFSTIWDGAIAEGNVTLILNNCVIEAIAPEGTHPMESYAGNGIALVAKNESTIEVNGGRIEASNHTDTAIAIKTDGTGATIRLRGAKLVSQGDSHSYDISIASLGGTNDIQIDSATDYLLSKVNNPFSVTITKQPTHGTTPGAAYLALIGQEKQAYIGSPTANDLRDALVSLGLMAAS